MHFSKMQELGHDYMVVDAVTQNIYLSSENIKRLADRCRGVGFDKLILIEPPYNPELDFHCRIFNEDGIEATQYGEGAFCIAHFLKSKSLCYKEKVGISTNKGAIFLSKLQGDSVEAMLLPPILEPSQIPFRAAKAENTYIIRENGQTLFCGVVGIGIPHCIVNVEKLDETYFKQAYETLKQHERFSIPPCIAFMKVEDPQTFSLYFLNSLAVESFCYISCASASFAIGCLQGHLNNRVNVMIGEHQLELFWQGIQQNIRVVGQATHIYDGYIRL